MPVLAPQAEITERLAGQVFQALEILLASCAGPGDRASPSDAAEPSYAGLLTVMLRVVFMLHAEARGLLPVEHPIDQRHHAVLGLFDQLEQDRRDDPVAMKKRFGAWTQLLGSCRAIMPPRRGPLVDPNTYAFLDQRLDDDAVHQMLEALLTLPEGPGCPRQRLCYRSLDIEQIGGVYEELIGYEVVEAAVGRLVIQAGDERRRTGSHYTPRELTEPLVARTLAPLLRTLEARAGGPPSSAALLQLKVVDPAMGSGAFLLEAVRQLADHVVAAWHREGRTPQCDPIVAARRVVAQRCIYGVDKNPHAVDLAKLSLWLVIGSKELPLRFVDHALRFGDSLVGLGLDWRVGLGVDDPFLRELIARSREAAIGLRHGLLAHATDEPATLERETLQRQADAAIDDARFAADLWIGAFFAGTGPRARDTHRRRRLDRLKACEAHPQHREALAQLRAEFLGTQTPFHWALEFPEVTHFDAVIGNPPFMGGRGVTARLGKTYSDWLEYSEGGSAAADLSARFFTRARALLGSHGTLGLIATNTIGQGDTRTSALAVLLADGVQIYDATIDLPWPAPGAAVTVAIVHAAIGGPIEHTNQPVLRKLDPATGTIRAQRASYINSRLTPRPERASPVALAPNTNLSFQGSIVLGRGFVVTPEQRDALVRKDPRNAERLKPYLGGAEVNRNPDQAFARYVIDFGELPLEQAERWPDLIGILRREVKPERAKKDGKKYPRMVNEWWKHWNARPTLYAALPQVSRCLVTARLTKHLCFSWQACDTVFSEQLIISADPSSCLLATLQSRVHERWARALGSSMETRLRYTPSDCFVNFPFPAPAPRTNHPVLEQLGEQLERLRSEFMLARQIGLTKLYNLLLGPSTDPRLAELRELHLDLDRAVLATYAAQLTASDDPRERELAPVFTSIAIPPYRDPRLPNLRPADRRALEVFNDEVLDALMALNEVRATQQVG